MKYSQQEIIQYVQEEDVKFIRLAFCDVFGKQKNISIMPDELQRAFSYGIAIDASAIDGFGDETHSDLFLHPEPDTLMPLPWIIYRNVFKSINMAPAKFTYCSHIQQHSIFIFRNLIHIFQMPLF